MVVLVGVLRIDIRGQMNKIKLYLSNLAIAVARMVKAPLTLYKYQQEDGYVKNVLVTLDTMANAILAGDPDETISSRSGKAQAYEQSQGRYGWGCRMCSFLAIFQQNHCAKALDRNKGHRAVDKDEGM
jgi:hypothetical protein